MPHEYAIDWIINNATLILFSKLMNNFDMPFTGLDLESAIDVGLNQRGSIKSWGLTNPSSNQALTFFILTSFKCDHEGSRELCMCGKIT